MRQNRTMQGFTLIELVMVIVLVSILSVLGGELIVLPIKSYQALERRAELSYLAEAALRRMQRDIRQALPNSIRISGGNTLEFLNAADGGRYRSKTTKQGNGDVLNFDAPDSSFDVMGDLADKPSGWVVIYNLGVGHTNADAYEGNNRAAVSNTSKTDSVVLTASKQFPFESPEQRFFIVDEPIAYRCQNNQIQRFHGYAISTSVPNFDALSYDLLLNAPGIACSFNYNAGSGTRTGLVTLTISLTDAAGESVTLIHQVHVDNVS